MMGLALLCIETHTHTHKIMNESTISATDVVFVPVGGVWRSREFRGSWENWSNCMLLFNHSIIVNSKISSH